MLLPGCIGAYIVGDMNIWHKRWLKHSPKNTVEGQVLHDTCQKFGLKEMVQQQLRSDLDTVRREEGQEVHRIEVE